MTPPDSTLTAVKTMVAGAAVAEEPELAAFLIASAMCTLRQHEAELAEVRAGLVKIQKATVAKWKSRQVAEGVP